VKRQHEVNLEMNKTERDSLNETENWRCKIKAETSQIIVFRNDLNQII